MTLLNELMTNYELDPALATVCTVAALSLMLAGVAVRTLVRVRRDVRLLAALQERLEVVNHSMVLLTDTTESCFKALSMQLQFLQSQNALRPSPRPEAIVRPRRAAAEKGRVTSAARPSNADEQTASTVSTFVA
jgi:hypothetical protein